MPSTAMARVSAAPGPAGDRAPAREAGAQGAPGADRRRQWRRLRARGADVDFLSPARDRQGRRAAHAPRRARRRASALRICDRGRAPPVPGPAAGHRHRPEDRPRAAVGHRRRHLHALRRGPGCRGPDPHPWHRPQDRGAPAHRDAGPHSRARAVALDIAQARRDGRSARRGLRRPRRARLPARRSESPPARRRSRRALGTEELIRRALQAAAR